MEALAHPDGEALEQLALAETRERSQAILRPQLPQPRKSRRTGMFHPSLYADQSKTRNDGLLRGHATGSSN